MKRLSWQFFKYIVIGALGTLIYAAVFGALNETIFSADKSLDDGTRQLNYILANSAAFLAPFVCCLNGGRQKTASPES